MRVLITGISGLLGTHLALLLLEKGYTVSGLVRNKKAFTLQHERLQLIEGPLFSNLDNHLLRVDCVIHAAACTSPDIINPAEYYSINCDATNRLLDASIKAGVAKFIFVSTANTIGYNPAPSGRPEDEPMKEPFCSLPYASSKRRAEDYVLLQQDKIAVHIINPGFIIGPKGRRLGSSRIILMALNRRLVFYPPGGKNFVAAADVAIAIEKCLTAGKNGRKYLVAGENMSYKDFFKRMRLHTGKRQWLVPLPGVALRLLGWAGDVLRYCRIKTSLCTANMRVLAVQGFYSNSSSVNELGMKYQDIDKAIAAGIRYFKVGESVLC